MDTKNTRDVNRHIPDFFMKMRNAIYSSYQKGKKG
jgi:hypothetical protein